MFDDVIEQSTKICDVDWHREVEYKIIWFMLSEYKRIQRRRQLVEELEKQEKGEKFQDGGSQNFSLIETKNCRQ